MNLLKYFTNRYFVSIFIIILFLFSPKPFQNQNCGSYVTLNSFSGFIIDADSHQYLMLSANPSSLLSKENTARRQNRPIYIYVTNLLAQPIKFIFEGFIQTSLADKIGIKGFLSSDKIIKKLTWNNVPDKEKVNDYLKNEDFIVGIVPYYISYVLLNFILLFFSVFLFKKLLNKFSISPTIIYWLSFIIVSNSIVKSFIWSAHEQMFLFLTPILIIFVIYTFLFEKYKRNFYTTTFLFGLSALAYGSFVLYLPVLILSLFYLDKNLRNIYTQKLNYKIHTVLFLLPTFSWIFICKYFSGNYYNHEVERYRELVWIIDSIKIDFITLFKNSIINILTFLFISIRAVLPFLIIWLLLNKKIKIAKIKFDNQNIIALLYIALFTFTGFFAVLGYYAYRLSFSISVLILILISLQLNTIFIHKPEIKLKLSKQIKVCVIVWCILNFLFYIT